MRSLRSRVAATAASLAVLAGIGVVQVQTASASGVPCDGRICVFDTTNVYGLGYMIPTGSGYFTLYRNAMDNRTSYIINNTGYRYEVFTDSYCRSEMSGVIYPHSKGSMNSTWDNDISCVTRS